MNEEDDVANAPKRGTKTRKEGEEVQESISFFDDHGVLSKVLSPRDLYLSLAKDPDLKIYLDDKLERQFSFSLGAMRAEIDDALALCPLSLDTKVSPVSQSSPSIMFLL